MENLIAGQYSLASPAASMPLGGLSSYAATERRDPSRALIAIQTRPALPPRARLLGGRTPAIPHALMPLDHGQARDPAGKEAFFIICPPPAGPSLADTPSPWGETELLRCLLLPAATALEQLAERGVTHRAIRPDNLFRAGPGEKVTLGPFWAAPPASLQPAAFEPPYAACCLPEARGDGFIADDVYALGVTILWCALGGRTGWGDEAALLRAKLSLGSLAALIGQARLSSSLVDLLHGMLAEDPDHRPAPSLLVDLEQARSRRLATRAAARAGKPLVVDGQPAWSPRELAWRLGASPDAGLALIRDGSVGLWLRRIMGDAALAIRLDEAVARAEDGQDSARAAPSIVTQAVATLDPLAPLVWRGMSMFPDGIGAALAASVVTGQGAVTAALEEVLAQDVTTAWLRGRIPRPEYTRMKQDVRDCRDWLSTKGMMGGLPRLLYGANPLLSCLSPVLGGRMVPLLGDLLTALEACAPGTDRKRPPFDAHIAAFIAARADAAMLGDAARLSGLASASDKLAVMGLFGRLQQRMAGEKLPGLAAWLLEAGLPGLAQWRCLATRTALTQKLHDLAGGGLIAPMVHALQEGGAAAEDEAGAERAANRLTQIDATLQALKVGASRRKEAATYRGREIATGLSLLSLLAGALTIALG